MKKIFYPLIILLLLLNILPLSLFGQGCSDAGFCTMGVLRPDQSFDKAMNIRIRTLEVSYYRGQSPLSPVIHMATLDANIGITNDLGFQIKVPYYSVNGLLGTIKGVGDVSLSFSQRVLHQEKFDLNLTLGTKIPTNKSDLKSTGDKNPLSKGLQLPMYYQTSLGSYDFIAGLSFISKKWMFATGTQIALTANENDFTWTPWLVAYSSDYVKEYTPSTHIKRGIDVMARVERRFQFSNFSFNIGILSIYRITPDRQKSADFTKSETINGTTGLASTVLSAFTYHLNVNNFLKLSGGVNIVTQKQKIDGLARNNVLILAYGFRF